MKKIAISIVLFLGVSVGALMAQTQTLSFMQTVPQSSQINPAYHTPYGGYIGFPVLSSLSMNFSSFFAYDDIIKRNPNNNDSLEISQQNFLKSLNKTNNMMLDFNHHLLDFGFRIKRHYFSLTYSHRATMYLRTDETFWKFVLEGNASDDILGKTVDLKNNRVQGIYYHQLALGYSYDINEALTVAIRPKVLFGMANISTDKSDLTLLTRAKTYDMVLHGGYAANVAYIDDVNNWAKNLGFGVDLGATYKWKDFLFSASVLDIGRIKWKDNARHYSFKADKGEVVFSGFDMNLLLSESDDLDKKIEDTLRSYGELIDTTQSYSTWLYPKITLGATYDLKGNHFSLLWRGDFANSYLYNNISLAYSRQLTRFFDVAVTYSIKDQSYDNLGVGLAINLLKFQIYMASDNLLTAFQPLSATGVNFHFGINIHLGKYNDTKASEDVEASY